MIDARPTQDQMGCAVDQVACTYVGHLVARGGEGARSRQGEKGHVISAFSDHRLIRCLSFHPVQSNGNNTQRIACPDLAADSFGRVDGKILVFGLLVDAQRLRRRRCLAATAKAHVRDSRHLVVVAGVAAVVLVMTMAAS